MNINAFKAIYPKLELIASPDSFFGTVKYQFKEYMNSGFFNSDEEDALFIYNIVSDTKTHRGLIACVNIDDYDSGSIIRHEETLPAKEQKSIHLIMQREAMVKPALLTYKNHKEIDLLFQNIIDKESPFFTIKFSDSGSEHSFIKVSNPVEIKKIESLFEQHIPKAYIADGHHRFSACSILNKSDNPNDFRNVLVSFFPFEELQILDFNRTVQILHEISPTLVMAKLSALFHISLQEYPVKPQKKHELVLLINDEWYTLKWKDEILDNFADEKVLLDTFLFNELVLKDAFGIKNVESDIRIGYVTGQNGIVSMKKTVRKNEHRIGFLLFPVSIEEMIHISEENLTLPPKSTWFEPRIINGLISKSL